MIEKYFNDGLGYDPFLIRDGWQVAQLNYVEAHGLMDIENVERHVSTDEVFILVKGKAVLLAAAFTTGEPDIEYINMKAGVTYNVPAGVWHNIAMSRDCEIIIVEKDHTHINDCEYHPLSMSKLQEIYKTIASMTDCDIL